MVRYSIGPCYNEPRIVRDEVFLPPGKGRCTEEGLEVSAYLDLNKELTPEQSR
jgi:hypothetical protein